MIGGHFFNFNKEMWNSHEPIMCHAGGCVMNVFSLLNLISRENAVNIVSKSRAITDKTILSFLDRTFHTKHFKEDIFTNINTNIDTIIDTGIDHLLSLLPEGFAVIAGLIGKPSHLAVISNEGGTLYLYDPTLHEKILMYSPEMMEYLENFSNLHVFISYYESTQTTLNSSQLKKNAIWNKHRPKTKTKPNRLNFHSAPFHSAPLKGKNNKSRRSKSRRRSA